MTRPPRKQLPAIHDTLVVAADHEARLWIFLERRKGKGTGYRLDKRQIKTLLDQLIDAAESLP